LPCVYALDINAACSGVPLGAVKRSRVICSCVGIIGLINGVVTTGVGFVTGINGPIVGVTPVGFVSNKLLIAANAINNTRYIAHINPDAKPFSTM
jgi:hypothetical protein